MVVVVVVVLGKLPYLSSIVCYNPLGNPPSHPPTHPSLLSPPFSPFTFHLPLSPSLTPLLHLSLYRHNRLLLCAPSNAAVDELLLRLLPGILTHTTQPAPAPASASGNCFTCSAPGWGWGSLRGGCAVDAPPPPTPLRRHLSPGPPRCIHNMHPSYMYPSYIYLSFLSSFCPFFYVPPPPLLPF